MSLREAMIKPGHMAAGPLRFFTNLFPGLTRPTLENRERIAGSQNSRREFDVFFHQTHH
jgi:hypothetical protein